MPSITAQVKERQSKTTPAELVKDYEIALYQGGQLKYSQSISNNCQRLNVLCLPEAIEADQVCVTVLSTHGHPSARIYEVRIY